MKKIAILLFVFFIGFSQAQTATDKNIQTENQKKESKKQLKTDPDARVFIIKKESTPNSTTILTREESLKNKKGYKRVNTALNKELKNEKRKERKSLRAQNRMFNKSIKQSKKRHKKNKKKSKKL